MRCKRNVRIQKGNRIPFFYNIPITMLLNFTSKGIVLSSRCVQRVIILTITENR